MTAVENLFWKHVDTSSGPTACWEWKGWYNTSSYGVRTAMYQLGKGGVKKRAARLAYELTHNRVVPDGIFVCHCCDNSMCVNPGHLFLGTPKDNTQDAMRKKRIASGERQGLSKLTEKDVRTIRQQHQKGVSGRSLARTFGVSQPTIQRIVTRQTWAHLF